jgi:hypothetical protein
MWVFKFNWGSRIPNLKLDGEVMELVSRRTTAMPDSKLKAGLHMLSPDNVFRLFFPQPVPFVWSFPWNLWSRLCAELKPRKLSNAGTLAWSLNSSWLIHGSRQHIFRDDFRTVLWLIHGGRLHAADRTIGLYHRPPAALWLQAEEDWIYTFRVCIGQRDRVSVKIYRWRRGEFSFFHRVSGTSAS